MPEQFTITTKEWYHMKKAAGVCTKCRREDAYTMAGRSLCAECAQYGREIMAKMWRDPSGAAKERHRQRDAHRRDERRMAGLCTLCGKEVETPYTRCPNCRAKIRARKERKRREAGIMPRGENGRCYLCNKAPALPGRRLCQACHDIAAANLPHGIQEDHPWRRLNAALYLGKS